ncbi:hypothetical protein OG909_30085 [Streptomyces sp. NBC_01754]|nr:hypothetical protein [Streptomyces sp. NBC_01754]WSC96206.1 hypothetical protein OG909_30085 [Streptomyces sp. NBC_01754]
MDDPLPPTPSWTAARRPHGDGSSPRGPGAGGADASGITPERRLPAA